MFGDEKDMMKKTLFSLVENMEVKTIGVEV